MPFSFSVPSSVSGVEFGFLAPEEVKNISVKRLTNPTSLDSLQNPVPGGLYDLALGPFNGNPCSTCYLQRFQCPGHCGHVELPVPVYHPMFMDQMLRLLRAKCAYCHHFKMPPAQRSRFLCKLRLIKYGLIDEARNLDDLNIVSGGAKKGAADGSDDSDSDVTSAEHAIEVWTRFTKKKIKEAAHQKRGKNWIAEKSEAIAEERSEVIKEFFREAPKGKKCTRCKAFCFSFRKDQFVKIFRRRMTEKERNGNIAQGFKYKNPLTELEKRQRAAAKAADKELQGDDEGVADVDSMSLDEESEDIEAEDVADEEPDEDIAGGLLADEANMSQQQRPKAKNASDRDEYMTAGEVHAALTFLFEYEQDLLGSIYAPQSRGKEAKPVTADMFFIKNLIVPPNRYRPETRGGGKDLMEADKNKLYNDILTASQILSQIRNEMTGTSAPALGRRRDIGHFRNAWNDLQDRVNCLIDKDKSPLRGIAAERQPNGIKQNLEKKEGLFRKNIMGKRVNFAARSVISPDPNIDTNEIGVPPVFAMKLTFPEPVTAHNFHDLREAVLNGPDKWPGAVKVEDENGQLINLGFKGADERMAIANSLLSTSSSAMNKASNKKVYRHLANGDMVIMNRQPTLHKPSMMAHRVKILHGEKTIRMHYSNCNSYNADFDGDEMNMHFPQNEIARAEAQTIANADYQYLSGTAGAPLRGLIQDHISMGVRLTNKDTMFDRNEYFQLLYAAIRPEDKHTVTGRIETIPPAIIKPKPMWTGKQIFTTILLNIKPDKLAPLNHSSGSQTAADRWGSGSEEGNVQVVDGYLVTGILDKKNIGPASGGLVHSVYEIYGASVAGQLLSGLSRLLTRLLNTHAFSCGVEDLTFTADGEETRRVMLKKANTVGLEVASKYVSLDKENPTSGDAELRRRLEDVLRDDRKQAGLDQMMNGESALLSSSITKELLPMGLVKQFPANQMQTMAGSGAKGSMVNANFISCNLGQQVLEGRRVPIMVSGKSLPCFQPFESNVRAGGYITDRFLTGIRPQEYFFHAMAGREGLIDTAVKTSSSGYLQRCVIKGMEGLKAGYDSSVRDADGTMIQFLYGEDSLEVAKQKYLYNFKFIGENYESYMRNADYKERHQSRNQDAIEWNKNASRKFRRTGNLGVMDPATAVFSPGSQAGTTSEKFYQARKEYCDENPDGLIASKKSGQEGHKRKNYEGLLDLLYRKSVIEPGEAVGVVAGQSIGEPSTQMTLNTFHLAGHAAKNVTLGIPRLREIIMTASANIKTPTMSLFFHAGTEKVIGDMFAKGLSRLSLAHITDKVSVTETHAKGRVHKRARLYDITIQLFPAEEYCDEYAVDVADIKKALELKFMTDFTQRLKIALRRRKSESAFQMFETHAEAELPEGESRQRAENEEDGDDDDGDAEENAKEAAQRSNKNQDVDYEEANDEDEEDLRNIGVSVSDAEEDEVAPTNAPTQTSRPESERSDDDDNDSSTPGSDAEASKKAEAADFLERMQKRNADLVAFEFSDSGDECSMTIEHSLNTPRLLVLSVLEASLKASTIQVIPGIASCTCVEERHPDPVTGEEKEVPVVLTEGTNLLAMRDYQNILDLNRITTNDVTGMLRLYGVEAARTTLVREITGVFTSHAISVDDRHIALIADVMTRGGGYVGFNRMGMHNASSALAKMSFETATGFLKEAVAYQDGDALMGPSAKISMGQIGGMGTGNVDVMVPVHSENFAQW